MTHTVPAITGQILGPGRAAITGQILGQSRAAITGQIEYTPSAEVPATPVTLFQDAFTDTDSVALASHSPDTDLITNGWVANSGSWIISGNKAVPTGTPPANPIFVATTDLYQPDVTLSCVVNVSANESSTHGVVFRYNSGDGSFLMAVMSVLQDRFRLFSWDGVSTFALLATGDTAVDPNTDYTIEVVLDADSIIISLNGTERINTTSTFNQGNTGFGLRGGSVNVSFNDFQVDGILVEFDDVFFVTGQSNAQGRLTNAQTYSGVQDAYVYDQSNSGWRVLEDPTDSDVIYGSVWPLLANLISANKGRSVAFVTTADGGTGLVSPDADWTKGGTQYDAAIAVLAAANLNKSLKAILWYQGERDAVNGIATATYQTALSQMLDDMQTDTGNASVKLIAALLGEYTGQPDANLNNIRNAIINRWGAGDDDILSGPSAHDQSFVDGLHWTTNDEALTLAQRWYRVIDYHCYGGTESPRGPQFSSAVRSGTTVTVTFTGGEGALENTTDTTGWKFTDDGTPITVTAVAANGSNAVDLTLASTPSGTELISYSQGNDVGGTLRDSGTYPLPAEPFVDQAVS